MGYSFGMKTTSRVGVGLLVAACAVLATSEVLADSCDPETLLCSRGLLSQYAESYERLPGEVDTGWLPECGTGEPPCEHSLQFRAQFAFDKVLDAANPPVYSVDMTSGAWVDAHWPETEFIELTLLPGGANDGIFEVTHSIVPEMALYLAVSGLFTGKIALDAAMLASHPAGAKFDYMATGNAKFRPWSFEPTLLSVKGNDLNSSKLVGISFSEIPDILAAGGFNDYMEGFLSLNATSDSTFTYQTTRVTVSGATEPISADGGMVRVANPRGDYLEVQVGTDGVILYKSKIDFHVAVSITKLANFPVTLNFPITVPMSLDLAEESVPVSFPNSVVHISLPNVLVPSTPIDFGTVETGDRSLTKKVTIENSGELGARLEFFSSDPQFKLKHTKWELLSDGDDFDLQIHFAPTKSGTQSGTITVKSNDPDSPVQQFSVSGNGIEENIGDQQDGGLDDSGVPDTDAELDGDSPSMDCSSSDTVDSSSDTLDSSTNDSAPSEVKAEPRHDSGCTVAGRGVLLSSSFGWLGLLGLFVLGLARGVTGRGSSRRRAPWFFR